MVKYTDNELHEMAVAYVQAEQAADPRVLHVVMVMCQRLPHSTPAEIRRQIYKLAGAENVFTE